MIHQKYEHNDAFYGDAHAGDVPVTAGRRTLKALAIGAAAVVLMLLTAMVLSITIQGKGERYQAALALLQEKNYAEAAEALADLDDFRDSAELLARLEAQGADYARAAAMVEEGRYDAAVKAFQALGDYGDSAQQAAWGVYYQWGVDLMKLAEAGEDLLLSRSALQDPMEVILDWETAAALLEGLGEVADATALARQCRQAAEALCQQYEVTTGGE